MIKNTKIRLNKALSILGICSRRNADSLILENKVFVNNKIANELGIKISENDTITIDKKNYTFNHGSILKKIWIYYKPVGLITTHKDEKNRKTVFDDIRSKINERVISIGRLDINSEGLLILTNCGEFARFAESPKTAWKRYYKVRIFGNLTKDIISKLENGVTIENIKYAPMKIIYNPQKEISKNIWIRCILTEGKNREIRKLFQHFGIHVNKLIRYKYGPYEIEDLKPGELKLIDFK